MSHYFSVGFRTQWIFVDGKFVAHHNTLTPAELGNGAIFTSCGVSVALIWHQNSIFVFDSHSRNGVGEQIENGHAVLIEIGTIDALNTFLKTNFEQHGLSEKTNFEWHGRSETQYDINYS